MLKHFHLFQEAQPKASIQYVQMFFKALFVFQEYETVMKGLDRNAPSVPPQNTPQEAQQVDMWKKYIQWEKSNPLRTEDQTLITKRGN